MSDRRTPIERMIDGGMKCTVCGARAWTCSCWVKCPCGWYYRDGESCRNTAHRPAAPVTDGGTTK